ncbi:MAG: hypothetical protein JWQ89_142 [Devosia sp.]|uniref:hypothetical protein n=1 Tax=Devosia sp. TaxID=1871048 RepID=UPI0026342D49|nr:hypothetical protein [Devosia sp.]MDB5538415.1 hypothetical protein [Devosia sp.]
MPMAFEYAMSIGPTCRAAYHLRRCLGPAAIKGVFDWQVTPAAAFVKYLERDFSGLLDFLDLEQTSEGVRNIRFDTLHPHGFTGPLPLAYPEARARHDHLCARTRAALKGPAGLVLWLSDPISLEDEAMMSNALRFYSPDLVYRVARAPRAGSDGPDWRGNNAEWDVALES